MLQDRPRLFVEIPRKNPETEGWNCLSTYCRRPSEPLPVCARASMVGEVRRHVTNGSKHRTTPSVLN